jgi:hypothetical protein
VQIDKITNLISSNEAQTLRADGEINVVMMSNALWTIKRDAKVEKVSNKKIFIVV